MVQQNDRGEEIYQPELRRKRCLKDIICLSRVRLLDKVGQEEKFWHVLNIEAPETGDGGCEINGVDLLRFSSNLHVGYGHIFNTYRYGIWIWIWNMDMDYILNMGICWIHIEIHCRLYTRKIFVLCSLYYMPTACACLNHDCSTYLNHWMLPHSNSYATSSLG